MPFNIGPGELIIVLIIALIVVGPGKLPDVGSALGKSIREFRKAATDVKDATSLEAPAVAGAQTQAPAPAVPATAASAVAVTATVAAAPPPPPPPPVAPIDAAADPVTPFAAPGGAAAESAGGSPAELTPSDEQPTPSA